MESLCRQASELDFYEAAAARLRTLDAQLDEIEPVVSEQREALRDGRARHESAQLHLTSLREQHLTGLPAPATKRTGLAGSAALLTKEGYLFKKSSKVAPKIQGGGWKRLYFNLHGGVLYYTKGGDKRKNGDEDVRRATAMQPPCDRHATAARTPRGRHRCARSTFSSAP